MTLEDLIEEIVGDIQDEYDWEERPVERQRDGSLVVEGTVSAAELRENYHVPIPESTEFETVAGFMLDALGTVPKGGEVVTVGAYRLTVVDVDRTRISKVKIEKVPTRVRPEGGEDPFVAGRHEADRAAAPVGRLGTQGRVLGGGDPCRPLGRRWDVDEFMRTGEDEMDGVLRHLCDLGVDGAADAGARLRLRRGPLHAAVGAAVRRAATAWTSRRPCCGRRGG